MQGGRHCAACRHMVDMGGANGLIYVCGSQVLWRTVPFWVLSRTSCPRYESRAASATVALQIYGYTELLQEAGDGNKHTQR